MVEKEEQEENEPSLLGIAQALNQKDKAGFIHSLLEDIISDHGISPNQEIPMEKLLALKINLDFKMAGLNCLY